MINQRVLVLNKNWIAVHICSVKRAMTLLYQDLARVVTSEYRLLSFEDWKDFSRCADEPVIQTPSFKILIPEVIMLTRFGKIPPRIIKFNRRNIYLRDNYTCQYCGSKPPREELTIDHIIPRSRGGESIWTNVVIACMDCNAQKGNNLLEETGMSLFRRPKKPHFSLIFGRGEINSPLWQKFIDFAYWNVSLDK